jgi:hypothetical protein
MVGLLTALPGTGLYQRLRAEGRVLEETVGNNTHMLTTNFKTIMDPEKLREGYKRMLATLYDANLKNYFARCNKLLDQLPHSAGARRRIRRDEIRAFAASLLRQPFTRYGFQYVKFLLRNGVKHRHTFAEAVTLGVMGQHFHTITQEMLKIDQVNSTLQQTYACLQSQLRQASRNMLDCSRDARHQCTDLWKQRNAMLKDLSKRIGTIHNDFRDDIVRQYDDIARQMTELLYQFQDELENRGYVLK